MNVAIKATRQSFARGEISAHSLAENNAQMHVFGCSYVDNATVRVFLQHSTSPCWFCSFILVITS